LAEVTIYRTRVFLETKAMAERKVKEFQVICAREARSNARRGPYSKGHLASTIHFTAPISTGRETYGRVIAGASYAHIVNGGARRHHIRPRPPKTLLKFYWRKAGRVVRLPFVNHPGFKGTKFMTRAGETAARLTRFKVKYLPLG
jgi:hypothetical protein